MSNLVPPQRIETWFRRTFWVCAGIATLGILGHLAILLWANQELTAPESIVAVQSSLLARHGTLYYDLASYPYTVCAYMPQFYLLEAGLSKLGLSTALAGRLISFTAMLGILLMVWKLVEIYTRDRLYASLAAMLCASTSLILQWGTVGQVDTLAIFWALAAFYQYARYAVRGAPTLAWAGACALLALCTKQTAIACPVAIFTLLLFTPGKKKTALAFGAIFAGVGLAIVFAINLALGGRFILNTVYAAIADMSLDKLGPHFHYILVATLQLIIVALVGIKQAWRAHKMAPYVYLSFAILVLAATAPKMGSDSNYQIESTVILIVCATIALHSLNFLHLVFSSSRGWVTLLQIPLAIHLVENFRITQHVLLTRVVNEQMLRAQVIALRPFVADGGRLLSADFNSAARLRDYMEVEPYIYSQLIKTHLVDPERVRTDIANGAFSTVFLWEDLNHRDPHPDPEVITFTDAQLDAIKSRYKMAAHIAGPYQDGIYVYRRNVSEPGPATNARAEIPHAP